MKPIHLQEAFVLHKRAYRETSLLIEFITKEHGRFSAVAKGVRKKNSARQSLLQPFVPLIISWTGKQELMTLTHVEAREKNFTLRGECLFAGFYLNELLIYLLQKWDPHPKLFLFYEQALTQLQTKNVDEKILRAFEKFLLEELGYGVLPKSNSDLEKTFLADKFYCFVPEQGFVIAESYVKHQTNIFSGKSLMAIAKEEWDDAQILQDAKRLMRFVLTTLLGAKDIHSRRLFAKYNEELSR